MLSFPAVGVVKKPSPWKELFFGSCIFSVREEIPHLLWK
jgi:hypothetical protein